MKVKQLIELLKEQDQDSEVILSKNGEGNDYSPLSDLNSGWYNPTSTWCGDFFSNSEDAEEMEAKEVVICLWPTN